MFALWVRGQLYCRENYIAIENGKFWEFAERLLGSAKFYFYLDRVAKIILLGSILGLRWIVLLDRVAKIVLPGSSLYFKFYSDLVTNLKFVKI
jgi:hypothetical protein